MHRRRKEGERKKEGEGLPFAPGEQGTPRWPPGHAVRRGSPGQSVVLAARAPSALIVRPAPVRVGSTKEQAWLQSQTNERLLRCFSSHLGNNHAATVLNSQPVLPSAAEAAASPAAALRSWVGAAPNAGVDTVQGPSDASA